MFEAAIEEYYNSKCPKFLGQDFNMIANKHGVDPDQLVHEIESRELYPSAEETFENEEFIEF